MKTRKTIGIYILILILTLILCSCGNEDISNVPDEGDASLISEKLWYDSDNDEHTARFMSNGNTAAMVKNEAQNVVLNHIIVDDIPIYEMYSKECNSGKMLFLFHGQGSRKEEYLYEMIAYAEAGYLCVSVDTVGHGERTSEEAIMSVEATIKTGKDIDVLLDYYDTVNYASTEKFALIGLSQGGSISYWYAAYGERIPSVLIVGSTTPDFNYQDDDTAIKNGKSIDSIWDEEKLGEFIKNNNPINNVERFLSIPIMSGNGLDDNIISYKGAESLEKMIIQKGKTNSKFYYFENVGHEVTEDFMSKVLPFLNTNM